MKIHIKGQELDLHYSMRMYIIFENIMGKSLSFDSSYSYTSLIVLFYSAIMATIQRDKLNMTLSYDEFMDWLDSNEPTKTIQEFSEWFTSQMTVNNNLSDYTIEHDTEQKMGESESSMNI